MPVLSSAVSALSTFYQDSLSPFDANQVEISTIRLLAKLPTIAAYAYKKSVGQPFLYPDNSLGLVENFLRMTFGFPAEPYDVDPDLVRALDLLFILHADHEQNCSTSTVRLVGSSEANLFASISAGINALFGPLHGGANSAVLEMLERIRDDGGDVGAFVKQGEEQGGGRPADGLRPPGLQELRPACRDHQEDRRRDPRPGSAATTSCWTSPSSWRSARSRDDYFIERKLYPNVDFYTGLIYRAMGFPTKFFTVLFALGRLPGWIAHWREMIARPGHQDRPPAPGLHRARPSATTSRSTSAEQPPSDPDSVHSGSDQDREGVAQLHPGARAQHGVR